MSGPAVTVEEPLAPRLEIEELRRALGQMLGAERRLRSRDHSRAGELSYSQWRALTALAQTEEMTAGELARSADLKPATVTTMLDHLEAAGIIERRRSTTDRRVCNVSLTPDGWKLLEAKLANFHLRWQRELADFSDVEIGTAVRVLARLAAIFDSLHPSAATDGPH